MITDEVRQSLRESVLCWLATVDENGIPNVSPKEMFIDHGDRLLIANIASPVSVKNAKANSNVCVSFIHVFKQKGFKLKGVARIVEPQQKEYVELRERLYTLGGREFDIKSVFEISINNICPIIAPSYWMFPDTTETAQIANAMETYKVSPRNPDK